MLIRILADNPGETFTRNIDDKFVSTVKQILRSSKDPSVQQMMRETMTSLYRDKAYDPNLTPLFTMWSKESGMQRPSQSNNGAAGGPQAGGFGFPPPPPLNTQRSHSSRHKKLPTPEELAARIEEAKTSASLLQQLVQSTPQSELKGNELIIEFADRCQSAQRSIQGYINADNPAPDDETMQTLIETTEKLSLALSKHSRALLQARRAAGGGGNSPLAPSPSTSPPPPSLPVRHGLGLSSEQPMPPQAPYGQYPPSAPYGEPPTVSPLQQHPVGGFDSYSPPPIPPPSSIPRKEIATAPESIAPVPVPPIGQSYSPPPMPPPSQQIPATEAHNPASRPPIPAAALVPSEADDDPFSDRNASPEDTAAPLPATGGLTHSGSLDRPGYSHVTSSYVRRQDSSEAHHTMHGAVADAPVPLPISPERKSERYYAGQQAGGPVSPVAQKLDDKSTPQ
jgi:hypothetical protein